MKYLKTYKSVNESTLGDLSFEDFQDILLDITDKYDDFEYYKQSNYYEIRIICELPDFLLNKDFVDVINNEKSELESINKQIDKMLKITAPNGFI